jgi:hypothetical protein
LAWAWRNAFRIASRNPVNLVPQDRAQVARRIPPPPPGTPPNPPIQLLPLNGFGQVIRDFRRRPHILDKPSALPGSAGRPCPTRHRKPAVHQRDS